MTSFMIRFFLCNILIIGIIGILLVAKRLFKNNLSSRMQYNLWFLLLGLLAVPFLPVPSIQLQHFNKENLPSSTNISEQPIGTDLSDDTLHWMNDFTVSIIQEDTSVLGNILLIAWIIGLFIMILITVKSYLNLRRLERSALPLQNKEVHELFRNCKKELNIHRNISIYSTAFIKSPFTVGLINPRIYFPIHLISDYNQKDCRFILLHELQHYRHGDAIVNILVNLANIIYWFNPFVWYALKEMRNDRELACDSSVLGLLPEQDYEEYGNTLINFAEKISFSAFPFVPNLIGNRKQIKKRILNIATYQPRTRYQTVMGFCSFFLIFCLLFGFVPLLTVNATEDMNQFIEFGDNITYIDLSSYFDDYMGCFVLYDSFNKSWQIYNETLAQKRISPDSTYKIYSALFALENGYITPTSNDMNWDGQEYPIPEWNENQNLTTAIQNSVNWYFQNLDRNASLKELEDFYKEIKYGNHDLSGGISNFWTESSLKISPLEQVELLQKLYANEFQFEESNIQAVKKALFLSSNTNGNLYGKTGTGNVNGQNINGWFIGYVESPSNTYFFALRIESENEATGSKAAEITMSILPSLNIW